MSKKPRNSNADTNALQAEIKQLREQVSQMKGQDSFRNFAAGIGYGTNNIASGGTYGYNPITLVRPLLEWMYRGQGLCGTIIDCVADDMTRDGCQVKGEMPPEDIEKIDEEAARLKIWQSINETIKWSRLYGGCVGVHMIDGQDMSTPLRVETVRKGQYLGILPLDRWVAFADVESLVSTMGTEYGLPEYYTVLETAPGLIGMKVHHTRCIRLGGIKMPWWQAITLNLWGESELERIWDLLLPYNSSTQGIAQLMYKLHLRTAKIKDLRKIVAAGGQALQGLMAQIAFMRQTQSNEGITILDAEDEFENWANTSLTGAADVLDKFLEQVAGATGIPIVKLLGQSPKGLNATGESDIRNYYDRIARERNVMLGNHARLTYKLLAANLGMAWPEGTTVGFKPLWQVSAPEKAEIASKITNNVVALVEAAVISPKTGLMEIKQSSEETGFGSNITDEDIEAAEDQPAPLPEKEEVAEIKAEGGEGEEESQAQDEFRESDHPRNPPGSSGGGRFRSSIGEEHHRAIKKAHLSGKSVKDIAKKIGLEDNQSNRNKIRYLLRKQGVYKEYGGKQKVSEKNKTRPAPAGPASNGGLPPWRDVKQRMEFEKACADMMTGNGVKNASVQTAIRIMSFGIDRDIVHAAGEVDMVESEDAWISGRTFSRAEAEATGKQFNLAFYDSRMKEIRFPSFVPVDTVIHEYGHHVTMNIEKVAERMNWEPTDWYQIRDRATAEFRSVQAELKQQTGSDDREWYWQIPSLKKCVSAYSLANELEWMAETWKAYNFGATQKDLKDRCPATFEYIHKIATNGFKKKATK